MDGHWQLLLLPFNVSLKNGDIQQWKYRKMTMTQHIEELYHPWACSPDGKHKKKRWINYVNSGPFTSYTSSNSKSPKQAKLSCLHLSISQVRVKKNWKWKEFQDNWKLHEIQISVCINIIGILPHPLISILSMAAFTLQLQSRVALSSTGLGSFSSLPGFLLPQLWIAGSFFCFGSQPGCLSLRKPLKLALSHHPNFFLPNIDFYLKSRVYLSDYRSLHAWNRLWASQGQGFCLSCSSMYSQLLKRLHILPYLNFAVNPKLL